VAHIHGHNVVAYVLRYAKKNPINKNFKIKELIVLEVPIIDVTEEINNSESIVDTVYNIIVGKYNIQVIDCLSRNYPFFTGVFEKKTYQIV